MNLAVALVVGPLPLGLLVGVGACVGAWVGVWVGDPCLTRPPHYSCQARIFGRHGVGRR